MPIEDVTDSQAGAVDLIADLSAGDQIDLAGIDADTRVLCDQTFSFIGTSAFTSIDGQLRVVNTSGNAWTVEADVDGDSLADVELDVLTITRNLLEEGNFVL